MSTIWLHDFRGMPYDEAREQLRFFPYGHVSFGDASAIGEFLTMYEQYVEETGEAIKIEDWVKRHYFHEKEGREIEPWLDGELYTSPGR